MKTILFIAITILSYIGLVGCGIWSIVGFILYLVKDTPFNWLSVELLAVSLFLLIVGMIGAAVSGSRDVLTTKRRFHV